MFLGPQTPDPLAQMSHQRKRPAGTCKVGFPVALSCFVAIAISIYTGIGFYGVVPIILFVQNVRPQEP